MIMQEFQRDATMRYLTEPEFHARVQLAVSMTEATSRRETGLSLGDGVRAALIQSCAYALMVAEIPTVELSFDLSEIEESMAETALQLGFDTVKREI